MNKLFGTDGIRGVANQFPLTPEYITRIGSAIGQVLGRNGERPVAIIGRDTRVSGSMIENALAAGLMAHGFNTLHIGVLTTPGIAFLAKAHRARCGISISASHNPFEDNGIKIFGADGFKIPDAREAEIEMLAESAQADEPTAPGGIGTRQDNARAVETYVEFLLNAVHRQPILRGHKVVVDCNNGATFDLAPRVVRELGAQVIVLNHQPDGVNINRGYDSLEPRLLRETVLNENADWGVQFDGDGDRSVFCDERGNYVDGDYVLAILARDWAARGLLTTRAVISTVMANLGLEKALKEIGVTLERTSVGDRWVTERMQETGTQIGGEQSGHIVMFDGGHTTGDGLYTTIRVGETIVRRRTTLGTLAACMSKYPQILVNVRVPRKPPLDQIPEVQSQLEQARAELGDTARILLRYSGTENLARIMIEGMDQDEITRHAHTIAKVIQEHVC